MLCTYVPLPSLLIPSHHHQYIRSMKFYILVFALISACYAFVDSEKFKFDSAVNQLKDLTEGLISSPSSTLRATSDEACWKNLQIPIRTAYVKYGICPKNHLFINYNLCVAEECPASVPYQCGIMCTTDASTCTREWAKITSLIFELIEKIQSRGDQRLPGAIAVVQKMVAFAQSFPKCDNVSNQSLMDQINPLIEQLISMLS